jgi:hypothetical protein
MSYPKGVKVLRLTAKYLTVADEKRVLEWRISDSCEDGMDVLHR